MDARLVLHEDRVVGSGAWLACLGRASEERVPAGGGSAGPPQRVARRVVRSTGFAPPKVAEDAHTAPCPGFEGGRIGFPDLRAGDLMVSFPSSRRPSGETAGKPRRTESPKPWERTPMFQLANQRALLNRGIGDSYKAISPVIKL